MAQNIGTLVAAPIRVNDSQDLYPSAYQSEIKGGVHWRPLIADKATFPVHLREAGMLLVIAEDGVTYQLANDLVTWNAFVTSTANGGSGGTTAPGTGGNDNTTATIISGNFGAWTALPSQSASIFDKQIDLQYKADLTAFPNRSTVFLTGQFGLKSDFVGTEITLGVLPVASRPKAKIKKWMACKGTELYLVVETTGAVKLLSKDGFNLPVATAGTEPDPYYIDVFFNPDIAVVAPTVYSYTRTEDFTRNNCGAGKTGSVVPFSKTYTSLVSAADAQAIAMADSAYNGLGQANANANGSCTVVAPTNVAITAWGSFYDFGNGEGEFQTNFYVDEPLTIDVEVEICCEIFWHNGSMNIYGHTTLPAGNTARDVSMPFRHDYYTVDVISVKVSNVTPNPADGKMVVY